MGSSHEKIKVAVIDLREFRRDFVKLIENQYFACNYYDSYEKFLENQSLKELSYIIIREKEGDQNLEMDLKEARKKIKESSVVAKTFQNMQDLSNQFNNIKNSREPLLRQKLIAYIRKYSLEKLVIYLFVKNVLDFKIPEYEEPYITLVADKIETIMGHILERPSGAEPLSFKFRRMVKDLYRRTVVTVLTSEPDKEVAKQYEREWNENLKRITHSISAFNQQKFQESLMSNYYNYIVVSNSNALSFIQDMKKKHKFQTLLIYHGDISKYGMEELEGGVQTKEKIEEVERSIWMHHQSIAEICKAIQNCTDIFAEETNQPAKNIVIYTRFNYGERGEEHFKSQLKEFMLASKNPKINNRQEIKKINFVVISDKRLIKQECKRVSFSYLITFDCTVNDIEEVKSCLRQDKFDKRVYMYNAEEKENVIEEISKNIGNVEEMRRYLSERAKKVVEKAGFVIKFEIGPLDEITTYKASKQELAYFSCEMGLLTADIRSEQEFQENYMSTNRLNIINGFCLVIKVKDYFSEFTKLMEKDLEKDPDSYLKRVKIIIFDDQKEISESWDEIKKEIKAERVIFVHYNLAKISEFLDILFIPKINLTIFVKKALPNFYRAFQKLQQSKFHPLQLVGSIVSKNELLKQVFGDQNFKLSTQYQLSFLKLANTNKNLQQALTVMHEQFLVKYGKMWRAGYDIVSREDKKRCIDTLKDDIKMCLYKCKSYELLQVSQQEFEYFYLKRLEECQTYIDLQIAAIYIFSLPHGLSSVVQMIFSDALSTCLTPKTFVGYIVTLLSCFCSFEDEVMNKQRFVVYIDETNTERFSSIIGSLKIGDVLFNSSFIMCGKDNKNENDNNNCLFLEFQDIPMLSETHVKNYLKIERFSFYKESTEYLIAPYTQFTVKNLAVSTIGKKHITLAATSDSKKGFVSKVFEANNIKQQVLFSAVEAQVKSLSGTFNSTESKRIMSTDSLYKKAEMISLCEQKYELTKSIKQGLQYNKFLNDARERRFMSALSHIKTKEQFEKTTTEIQATYFKKMLSVEKSMLYYHLCEYDLSLKELEKVTEYLEEQEGEGAEWVIRKVKSYKQSIQDLKLKRQKYLNRFEKVKSWRIQPEVMRGDKQNTKLGVKMSFKTMNWEVGYNCCLEEFYIEEENEDSQRLVHYSIKPPFGELATVFPHKSAYQPITERPNEKQNCAHLKVSAEGEEKVSQKQAKRGSKQKNSILASMAEVKPEPMKLGKIQLSPIQANKKQSKPKDEGKVQLPTLQKGIIPTSDVSIVPAKQNDKKSRFGEGVTESKVIFEETGSRLSQFSNQSILRQREADLQLSEDEMRMGVRERMSWQVFFFNGKFILTQKGKHYKAKLPNIRNL